MHATPPTHFHAAPRVDDAPRHSANPLRRQAMSGLEVLGAIASVSQLSQCSFKLVVSLKDLSRNIDRSAKRFRSYKNQVEQLRQVAILIQDTAGVQDDLLVPHVEALLTITEDIDETIKQNFVADCSTKWKKYWTGLQIAKAEESILKGFKDLERYKSSLTLCILEKYGSLILQIDATLGNGIPELQEQVGKIERSLRACSVITDEDRKITTHPTSFTAKDFCADDELGEGDVRLTEYGKLAIPGARTVTDGHEPAHNGCSINLEYENTTDHGTGMIVSDDINDIQSTDSDRTLVAEQHRTYTNNTACGQAIQLNGDFGTHSASPYPGFHSEWTNNQATGTSNQINGDILDTGAASTFFLRR